MMPETLSIFDYIKLRWHQWRQKRKQRAKRRRYKRLKRRGYWYCAHCDKMHPPRVIEYQMAGGDVDSVCSIGRSAYLVDTDTDTPWQPDEFEPLIFGVPYKKEAQP